VSSPLSLRVPRPGSDEYAAFYGRYVALVEDDALDALRGLATSTPNLLLRATEAQAAFRYAPEKWSVKQVVGHLCDVERVFGYRALRIARADATPLPGFDEDAWAANAGSDARDMADLVAEYRALRASTLALFASFDEAAYARRGTANGHPISVRALAHVIAGHERAHVAMLHERYGLV
jgi:DinB superfamily